MKRFPPIRMAETIIVIIPIGAIPRRMSSHQLIDVDRNRFVISSPKSVRRGAKSENALLAKLLGSTVGAVAEGVEAVNVEVVLVSKAAMVKVLKLECEEFEKRRTVTITSRKTENSSRYDIIEMFTIERKERGVVIVRQL